MSDSSSMNPVKPLLLFLALLAILWASTVSRAREIEASGLGFVELRDIYDIPVGQRLSALVKPERVKKFVSKAGKTHVRCSVADETGTFSAIMFDGTWKPSDLALLQSDQTIIARAQVSRHGKRRTLILEEIKPAP